MRLKATIEAFFTQPAIIEFKSWLSSQDKNPDVKLALALQILNIKSDKFHKIPFKRDQVEFLNYKYTLTHFELYPGKFNPEYQKQLLDLKDLFMDAKNIVKHYLANTKNLDKYSRFSQGLSTLFQRSGDYHSPEDNAEDLNASVIHIGDKPGGIEPGFIAAHYQDLIRFLYKYFNNDEALIAACIEQFEGNIENIRKEFEENIPQFMPKYMYKLDYSTEETKLNESGKTPVFLTTEDVKRTSNLKKCYEFSPMFAEYMAAPLYVYGKNSTAEKINKEAVLETLSNDLASIFMPVQTQKLFKTTYKNGDLKFMPYAEWMKGGKDFGSTKEPLAGGNNDDANYKVRPVMLPQQGIRFLSDDSLEHSARFLFPLLFTGDYDKVGSKGQNLMVIKSEPDFYTGATRSQIVGIDFGHSLREANRLIDSDLKIDGRFSQPLFSPFKNFSALSDGSLREKMEGLFILARLKGETIPDTIVQSYGEAFYQYYLKIESGTANILCENYMHAMRELQKSEPRNRSIYDYLVNSIQEFQAIMNDDLTRFMNKFKPWLEYEANLIDLLDNLTKYSAAVTYKATTIRSTNGEVGLNHLVIKPDFTKTWTAKLDPVTNHYQLFCEFGPRSRQYLKQALMQRKHPAFQLSFSEQGIHCQFPHSVLPDISALFSEMSLIQEFHPTDYAAIVHAKNEIRLQNLMAAPWFSSHHLILNLEANPVANGCYQVRIEFSEKIHEKLLKLFEQNFSLSLDNLPQTLHFSQDLLVSVCEKLENIQKTFDMQLQQEIIDQNHCLKQQKLAECAQRESERTAREEAAARKEIFQRMEDILKQEREKISLQKVAVEQPLTYPEEPEALIEELQTQPPLLVIEEEAEFLNDGIALANDGFETGCYYSLALLKRYYEGLREPAVPVNPVATTSYSGFFYKGLLQITRSASDSYNYYANENSSSSMIFCLNNFLSANDASKLPEIMRKILDRKEYIHSDPVLFKKEESEMLEEILEQLVIHQSKNPNP